MKRYYIIIYVLTFVGFISCKKQPTNQPPVEENELITTVKFTFVDSLTSDTLRFKWTQPGGPGTLITADTIELITDRIYLVSVTIFDESKTPIFNVSDEIKKLQNEHRFFYTSTTSRMLTQIIDFDTQNPPMELGLRFRAITSANGTVTGNFRALLRHYTASSPKTGGAMAGTADIDVILPLRVQ
ncbi:MAG: hypothetical protein Q8M15_15630 [Bacteroidota bacterium]|nr:hypothetical protein [Bacteroidota bacterium]